MWVRIPLFTGGGLVATYSSSCDLTIIAGRLSTLPRLDLYMCMYTCYIYVVSRLCMLQLQSLRELGVRFSLGPLLDSLAAANRRHHRAARA